MNLDQVQPEKWSHPHHILLPQYKNRKEEEKEDIMGQIQKIKDETKWKLQVMLRQQEQEEETKLMLFKYLKNLFRWEPTKTSEIYQIIKDMDDAQSRHQELKVKIGLSLELIGQMCSQNSLQMEEKPNPEVARQNGDDYIRIKVSQLERVVGLSQKIELIENIRVQIVQNKKQLMILQDDFFRNQANQESRQKHRKNEKSKDPKKENMVRSTKSRTASDEYFSTDPLYPQLREVIKDSGAKWSDSASSNSASKSVSKQSSMKGPQDTN